jgi:hypothetical protein
MFIKQVVQGLLENMFHTETAYNLITCHIYCLYSETEPQTKLCQFNRTKDNNEICITVTQVTSAAKTWRT